MRRILDSWENGYGLVQVATDEGMLSCLDFSLEGIKALLIPMAQPVNYLVELFNNFNQCLDPEALYINISSRAYLVEAFLGDESKVKHDRELYKHIRVQLAKLSKKKELDYQNLFRGLADKLFGQQYF